MIQPQEDNQIESDSRAKEINQGTLPMSLQNVMLGLPMKPGIQFDNQSSVKATPWSYDQLVSQKQLLGVFNINTTTPTSNPVFALRNSWENIRRLHFKSLDALFYFKSWKWKLKFEFRSNFQQVGMMTLSYVNCPSDALVYLQGFRQSDVGKEPRAGRLIRESEFPAGQYITGPLDTLQTIYQLPHTLIMMGEDQDVECTFNWLSPFKSSFSDRIENPWGPTVPEWPIWEDPSISSYDMGMIRLHVPVQMTVSQGVNQNLTVRVYSELTDINYAGYVPQDNLV